MGRTRTELAMAAWCLAIGAGLFGWLAVDLAAADVDTAYAAVARAAGGCFWWSLAAVMLSRRWVTPGLAAAAVSVGVLLTSLALGLLLVPADFVTDALGPRSPAQARGLGALLALVVVAGGAWTWNRRRGRG